MTDSTAMAYPLVAKTNCSVAGKSYLPGATFDALTQSNADFLLARGAAQKLVTPAALPPGPKIDLDALAGIFPTATAPAASTPPPLTRKYRKGR